jgi:hypothetical protein
LAGAGLGLVLGRNGGEKGRSGLLGCTEEKRKEVEGWAGLAREYGPRGFWKILKTFLFTILIRIKFDSNFE